MSKLFDSFTTADAYTYNGALTNSTTSNPVLDLFSTVGSLRGKTDVLRDLFTDALCADEELAVRCMYWARDARQGAGERLSGRVMLNTLAHCYNLPDVEVQSLLSKMVEVGRWDDLFAVIHTNWEKNAFALITDGLIRGDALCAKWMPREGKEMYKEVRKGLGVSPKTYRQMMSRTSETVEQAMCAKRWNEIEYPHVPSQANLKYVKAFLRNDEDRYRKYLSKVAKGEAKINASVAYPYEVLRRLNDGNAQQMWDNLPNYMEGNNERILPLVDVSGSMIGGRTNPPPMDIAIGLGLYISERNEGPFKDEVMTFSARPQMHKIVGTTLPQRVLSLRRMEWGYNTDLTAVFDTLLKRAKRNSVSQSQMPTMILILSDMEFDEACRRQTNYQTIKNMYAQCGYTLPKIVFWNLNARVGNNPVKAHDANTALVSGFSPSILKSLLSGKTFDPTSIMMDTLMKDRYDWRQYV